MINSKKFLSLALFSFSACQPAVATDLSCAEIVHEIAVRGLEKNISCESCFAALAKSLSGPQREVFVLASWLSTETFTFQDLLNIKSKADENGIEILSDVSSQFAYKHPSWNRNGTLVNFVFRGSTQAMFKFFKSMEKRDPLAHFEILNKWTKKYKIDFVTLHSRFENERQQALSRGLQETQDNLVLINDVDSKTFFAVVSFETYQELNPNPTEMMPLSVTEIVGHWAEYIQPSRFPLFIGSDVSQQAAIKILKTKSSGT